MMLFVYIFKDGTVLKLFNKGFSLEEIRALEKVHGKCESIQNK